MKREGGGGDGASVMSEKSLLSKPGKLPSSSAPAAVAGILFRPLFPISLTLPFLPSL